MGREAAGGTLLSAFKEQQKLAEATVAWVQRPLGWTMGAEAWGISGTSVDRVWKCGL